MENVGVLWHPLISLLMQSRPSHVLIIILSNKVEFLLEGIKKGHPSGSFYECYICVWYLPVTFPSIFDMGNGFKERKGDLFNVNFFLNTVITL
jgi:hypothetical protein